MSRIILADSISSSSWMSSWMKKNILMIFMWHRGIKTQKRKVIKLQINIFMTVELFHVKIYKINIKMFSEEMTFFLLFLGFFNWETISVWKLDKINMTHVINSGHSTLLESHFVNYLKLSKLLSFWYRFQFAWSWLNWI